MAYAGNKKVMGTASFAYRLARHPGGAMVIWRGFVGLTGRMY